MNVDLQWLKAFDPVAGVAWAELNGTQRIPIPAASAEGAQAAFAALKAGLEAKAAAKEAAAEARRQAISAEGVARAIAKAAATPHFAGALTFLKLVQYRDTVPYFDEIRSEMDRLAAEAEVAEREEA